MVPLEKRRRMASSGSHHRSVLCHLRSGPFQRLRVGMQHRSIETFPAFSIELLTQRGLTVPKGCISLYGYAPLRWFENLRALKNQNDVSQRFSVSLFSFIRVVPAFKVVRYPERSFPRSKLLRNSGKMYRFSTSPGGTTKNRK